MLGRLRMSVVDAIDYYERLTKTVFKATQVGKDGKFKHKILERVIKDVVKMQVGIEEERMLDMRDNACKTCANFQQFILKLMCLTGSCVLVRDWTCPPELLAYFAHMSRPKEKHITARYEKQHEPHLPLPKISSVF